ncbi:sulfurtransferase complex subunit TusC [Cobetia sp. MMG027]|uniref:sulfurtransferase complex subunit TusC n=1 Tax=Cobetia sp. MMG027 TaxID=3021980 RepID=UPI0022FF2123|nr:sulfurtransferase complex subunit TusC [Cobetia sp. MMG027]MDA5562305.1 sulfurtransferase complex subunit TusC [Cobetia sp. MMG027]
MSDAMSQTATHAADLGQVSDDLAPGDLLILLRHAPHGSSWLREGLEAAMVAAAFGREVGLLFSGDGVLALLEGQQPGALGQKGSDNLLAALDMYDVQRCYVDATALRARGLSVEDIALLPVTLMEHDDIVALTGAFSRVLSF